MVLSWLLSVGQWAGLALLVVLVLLRVLDKALEWVPPRFEPKDKVVLVTGGSSGIGAELARQLAAQGAKVAICARRADELKKVADEIRASMPRAVVETFVCDVAVPDQCRKMVQDVLKRFSGQLDCTILNAGVSQNTKFEEVDTIDHYRRLFQVNVFGVMDVLHAALPALLKSSVPRICVVSSMAGKAGVPFRTGYSASKFAVNGFCDSLRLELRPRGAAVTVVCPGPVRTNIVKTRLGPETGRRDFDMVKAQAVDDAAEQIIAAIRRGDREAMIGRPKFRRNAAIMSVIQPWAFSLVDRLIVRSCKEAGFMPEEDDCGMPPRPKAS